MRYNAAAPWLLFSVVICLSLFCCSTFLVYSVIMCRTPLSAVVYRKNSKYLVAGASKGTPGGAIKMRHGYPRMGAKK